MTREFKPPQAYSDKPRPPIALVPVTSNKIKAIGYDADSKTLAVTFNQGPGAVYHYPGIEPDVHAALIGAESIGKAFGIHIQMRPFEKFPPAPEKAAAAAESAQPEAA